ncbi:MAG: hypothetical protein ABUR63_07845, partial [Verrucomicrobiota bacterium]
MSLSKSWVLAAFTGFVALTAGCTPATNDPPLDTGAAGQMGKPPSTGGATGSGGTDNAGSGGAVGTGGSAVGNTGGNPGSGGSPATGGTTGSGGATGAGGSGPGGSKGMGGAVATGSGGGGGSPASGCNWVHDTTNDTWAFAPPAQDKIVLFDGTSLDGWHKLNMPGVPVSWMLIPAEKSVQVVPSGTGQATEIQRNMKFDDVCVHVEYLTPAFPSTTTDVQKQGNSGVYLKSA